MFPLYSKSFPSDAIELAALLNDSVKKAFSGAANPVTIRGDAYPKITEIRISLDGAELRTNAPRPPLVPGKGAAAIQVEELHINGNEMLIGPAIANLRLGARDVRLNKAADNKGEFVLLLKSAADGEVEITTDKRDLENAIAAVAKAEAAKHGVAIDQVQLTVRPRGSRSLDAEVQLRGKKLFFTTIIRIAAKLDLDEELNATVSGLACNGDGAIGSMACGFLDPHLQKINGRSFPLMALPLGEVRLRDVRIAAADKISVTAEFGA
jgi:hypothetical protein